MPSRVSAFVIWALLAASAMYWLLRLEVGGPAAPPYTQPVRETPPVRGDLTRLLGAAPVAPVAAVPQAPAAASRFKLVGVAAPLATAPQGGGIAVISIDGKPARAYRVGARIEGDLQLRSVSRQSAELGTPDGSRGFALQVPPRQAAATGTLPLANLRAPADNGDDDPAPVTTPPSMPVPSVTNGAAPVMQPGDAPEATPPVGVPVLPRARPGTNAAR